MNAADSVLLDTTVVVAHFRKDESLAIRFKQAAALYLPLVCLGELLYGTYKSLFQVKGQHQIKEFLRICAVLLPDEQTAHHYARAKARLDKSGKPIPQNDLWIAAVALEHNLPLVTRDAHFSAVEGLSIFDW